MTRSDQPTARGDTFALVSGDRGDEFAIYTRVQYALEAAAKVYMRDACWTQEGARYMGVPFVRHRF